ncbi:hypothetical protein J6590_037996 [Homalodisca vitripennis]|nr:hypothetical protein J6590_037996 [Homalodisca vitripennis]
MSPCRDTSILFLTEAVCRIVTLCFIQKSLLIGDLGIQVRGITTEKEAVSVAPVKSEISELVIHCDEFNRDDTM